MKKYLALLFVLLAQGLAWGAQAPVGTTVEYVTTGAPQTLTNKTYQNPKLTGLLNADPTLIFRLNAAGHVAPWTVGGVLPNSCEVGDAHFMTAATPGSNIYICTAPNTWQGVAGGGGGAGDLSSNSATSVDSEIALFSGTSGKLIKRSAVSGLLKSASGVLSSWSLAAGSSKIIIANPAGTAGNPSVDVDEAQLSHANIGGNLPAGKLPALIGDVTMGAGTGTTVLANLPNGVPMAGAILATNIVAPSQPTSGTTRIYVDSTSKMLSIKNDAGTVGTTVVNSGCGGGQFVNAITAGVIGCTTPPGGGDVASNTATSVDSEMVLFSSTTGKLVKRSNLTGLVKSTAGVVSAASSGTDYAPATSGTAILKGSGTGGFAAAASGTDYAPRTPVGTAILKANNAGGFASASAGTDYAPATSGTALLKGNNTGGFAAAVASSDYAPATSGTAILKGNNTGGFANASAGTDYAGIASNNTFTGQNDFSGATLFVTRRAAGATSTTNGGIAYDSTANMLHAGQSSADAMIPQFTVTPVNAQCATWVVSGSNYKLGTGACGGAGGTPGGSNTQLQYNATNAFAGITGATSDGTNVTYGSGNLRATLPRITTGLNDANGLLALGFTATASAVNNLTLANAAALGAPSLTAVGTDTNINIALVPKGTGTLCVGASCATPVGIFDGGTYNVYGSSSGVISIVPQAAAGTYNLNLPITPGATGDCLTSAAGGSNPMTWKTCDKAFSITLPAPTTGDTDQVQVQFASAVTLTKVGCSVDSGTMTIQFDKRGQTTPNTAGTNALTASLVCDTNRQETTAFSSAAVTAAQVLNLQITAASGTPGVLRIHGFARP